MRVGTTLWFGHFFNGRLTQVQNFITWTEPSGRLQLELDTENDFGHLPFGNFVQRRVTPSRQQQSHSMDDAPECGSLRRMESRMEASLERR